MQYNFTVIKRHKKAEVKAILKRCVHKRNQACNHQNTPKNATYDYSLPQKKYTCWTLIVITILPFSECILQHTKKRPMFVCIGYILEPTCACAYILYTTAPMHQRLAYVCLPYFCLFVCAQDTHPKPSPYYIRTT